jgi:DNA-binding transcriptional LysR family regulator
MDVEKLIAFAEVVRQGSVTRAAQRLHMQQPALSHRLAALERELGTPLFERLHKRLKLTPAGETLLPYATQITSLTQEAMQAARTAAGLAAARLQVGCAETPATYLLPDRLRELRRCHPELEVRLTVGNAARVLSAAVSGEVDLAVLTDREKHPRLRGETFMHDRFVAVVAADDPWRERSSIAAPDLMERRLLLREVGAGTRSFVDGVLRAAGVEVAETLEVASLEALKRMAEAGIGVAVVPSIAVQREAGEGRLHILNLAVPGNRISYRLLWHRDRTLPPGAALFRAIMVLG